MKLVEEGGTSVPKDVYEVRFLDFFDEPFTELEWPRGMVKVVRFHTEITLGDLEGQTVPGSVLIKEAPAWFRVMGATEALCENFKRQPTERVLENIASDIEKHPKRIRVNVGEQGWIRNIIIPDGNYFVSFENFFPRDEANRPFYKVSWRQTKNRSFEVKSFFTNWRIKRGYWRDLRIVSSYRYPILWDGKELILKTATKSGSIFLALLRVFQINPEAFSPWSVKDCENILPEVEASILKSPVKIVLLRVQDGWGQPESLAQLPLELRSPIEMLLECVAKNCENGVANKELTETGRAWIRQHLVPLARRLGLNKKFSQFSAEEMRYLLSSLRVNESYG